MFLLIDSQKAASGENPQAAGVPLTNDTNTMVYLGGDQISFASPVSFPKSLSWVPLAFFFLLPFFWALISVSRRKRGTVPREMIAVEAVTRLLLKWGPSGLVFVSPLSFCKRDIGEWVGDQILWQRNDINATVSSFKYYIFFSFNFILGLGISPYRWLNSFILLGYGPGAVRI